MIDESVWERMKTGGGELDGVVRRRLASAAGGYGVFAGVDQSSGRRMVLIETGGHGSAQTLSAAGLEVHVRRVARGSMIEVTLTNPAFADVFTTFVNDLAELALRSSDASEVRDRVATWIDFFAGIAPEGLASGARRGLWGELVVLRDVLLDTWPAERATRAWTGPDPGIYDFASEGVALEVKTSAAHQDQRLAISSERQLDDTNLRLLLLVQLAIDIQPGTTTTLPALVDELRTRLDGGPGYLHFERQLLRAGYLSHHAPVYAEEQYAIRTMRAFRVAEGFPRIIEPLPDGVGRVRYELSTSACAGFAVDWSTVPDLIREVSA